MLKKALFPFCAIVMATPAMAAHLMVTPDQVQRLGIHTAPASPAQTKTVVSVLARVTPAPGARLPVSAPFAGTVKTLIRLEGEGVKKGEPLVVIVSSDMRDSLAKYQSAQARFRTAQAAADRARLLVQEGIAPASRTEEANASAAAALAELSALRSTMNRAAHSGDGEYSLIAPANGRIAGIAVSVGEQVSATQPVLALDTGEEVWAEAALPASEVGKVVAGDHAAVERSPISGTVVAAGASVDPKTRSAMVRVRLDHADGLVTGQSVRLAISAIADRGSFNVPRGAVTEMGGKTVVFVMTKGGFDPMPVHVLARGPIMATIAGPLKPEEVVAITGVTELKAISLQD